MRQRCARSLAGHRHHIETRLDGLDELENVAIELAAIDIKLTAVDVSLLEGEAEPLSVVAVRLHIQNKLTNSTMRTQSGLLLP
jgi:hypothetical protein